MVSRRLPLTPAAAAACAPFPTTTPASSSAAGSTARSASSAAVAAYTDTTLLSPPPRSGCGACIHPRHRKRCQHPLPHRQPPDIHWTSQPVAFICRSIAVHPPSFAARQTHARLTSCRRQHRWLCPTVCLYICCSYGAAAAAQLRDVGAGEPELMRVQRYGHGINAAAAAAAAACITTTATLAGCSARLRGASS